MRQPSQYSTVPVSFGGYSGMEEMGSTTFSSYGSSDLGNFVPGSEAGPGYSVQLLAGAGPGAPLSSLTPVGPVITTWILETQFPHLSTGYWDSTATVNLPMPGTVTVAIASWYNNNGANGSITQAQQAGDPWGVSSTADMQPSGGAFPNGGALPTSIPSFSMALPVPEPATITLGLIGASSLFLRRRR